MRTLCLRSAEIKLDQCKALRTSVTYRQSWTEFNVGLPFSVFRLPLSVFRFAGGLIQ